MIAPQDATVIIPAYNVEEYLRACLDSVLDNGGAGSSIIVVDDGSSDGTAAIAASYAAEHRNIELVQVSNGGQAAARNHALAMCATPFVTFLDADDKIAPGGLSRLFEACDEEVDIVFSNRIKFYDRNGRTRLDHVFENAHHVRMKDLGEPLEVLAIHGKLFRTGFLADNNIRFPEGMVWEDLPFSYETYLHAELVSSIADVTYLWRRRAGPNVSTMQALLTPHSIQSRIRQIRLTSEIYSKPEWQARFGRTWCRYEFGKRMMMHVNAMTKARDEATIRRAFDMIRAFVLPYREAIERRLTGRKLALYEDIFEGRVERFLAQDR